MMRRSIAFTLIELLVVIAIIAILAAILFPVFAQAKVAAKKSQDLSNCKNHATAIIMYSADYDDMFPRQWYKRPNNDVWGWNTPFTWREAVMPYVKNGQQAYDDGSRRVLLAQGGIWDHPMKPGARGTYQSNRNLMPGACYWNARGSSWDCDQTDAGYPTGLPVMPSVSTTQLDAPAQIVSTLTVGINPDWNASGDTAEASWWWFGGAQWPPVFTGPTSHEKWDADSTVFPSWSIARYRFEGMNNAYADGHAQFVKKGAFNWCKYMYVKGMASDMYDNWDWLFESWAPCAPFVR